MMSDQIEQINQSTIQHGDFSNRIYLMNLANEDVKGTIEQLEQLAKEHNYTKIIVKSPAKFGNEFEAAGYFREAFIPRFFNGEEDLYFMSKFYSDVREQQKNAKKARQILNKAIKKHHVYQDVTLEKDYEFKVLGPEDTEEMAKVFKKTFHTYPFPIFDANYLKQAMKENVVYFGVFHRGKLVAASSCEIYPKKSSVEMTDFAILEKFRGRRLSIILLAKMEEHMRAMNIKTAYAMANAQSFGMNITFAKFGYKYTGTLLNNANLGGELKSLNIWYKPLQKKN